MFRKKKNQEQKITTGIEITLPVIEKSEIKNNKLVRKYGERKFILDMSLAAEVRFNAKFPEQSQRMDLAQLTESLKDIGRIDKATILSQLKVLYCYFDTELTFIEFLQLFDLSDLKFVQKIANRITDVFSIIFDNASEKN